MSFGKLLLTAGVALWVFDAKKLPKLASDLASIVSVCQRYYQRALAHWDALVQQEVNKETLAHNNAKSEHVENNIDNTLEN